MLAAAWLLKLDMALAFGIWAYTIAGATLVNFLSGHRSQRVVAEALFAVGGAGAVL